MADHSRSKQYVESPKSAMRQTFYIWVHKAELLLYGFNGDFPSCWTITTDKQIEFDTDSTHSL